MAKATNTPCLIIITIIIIEKAFKGIIAINILPCEYVNS